MDTFVFNLLRFWYTVGVVFLMARFLYYTNRGNREYLFTCVLLSAMISLICLLISRVDFTLGFAIGIFALFGILRYRTIPIMPREMTYIFLSAGIAAKNALVPMDLEIYKLFLTDASLLLIAGLLEYFLFRKKLSTKTIVYNNLDLIHPDKRPELIQDLNSRFGLGAIEKIKVGKIDTLKSAVRLRVFFKDPGEDNFDED